MIHMIQELFGQTLTASAQTPPATGAVAIYAIAISQSKRTDFESNTLTAIVPKPMSGD
jgi:hypothetical protein